MSADCLICSRPTSAKSVLKGQRGSHCSSCGLTFIRPPETDAQSAGAISTMTEESYTHGMLTATPERDAGARALVEHRVAFFEQHIGRRPRVLEVGCGAGLMARQYLEIGCDYVGIDIDERVVESGTQRGLPLLHMDLMESDLDHDFDLVTGSQVLEHITAPVLFARAAAAHVRPGGFLHFDVPNQLSLAGTPTRLIPSLSDKRSGALEPPHHCIGYTPQAMRAVLERACTGVEAFATVSNDPTWGQPVTQGTAGKLYYAAGQALRRGNLVVGYGRVAS